MDEMVIVGCRLPHGLVLQLQEKSFNQEPVMGGGSRKVEVWNKVGPAVTLKGWATPIDRAPTTLIVNGFAVTRVNAEFMKEWMKQNALHPAVTSDNIIVMASTDEIKAETEGRKKEIVGFEPHDPKNVIPEFKRQNVESAAAA
ncbi:hypothetical protein [Labrys neptuniae]